MYDKKFVDVCESWPSKSQSVYDQGNKAFYKIINQ